MLSEVMGFFTLEGIDGKQEAFISMFNNINSYFSCFSYLTTMATTKTMTKSTMQQ